MIYDGSRYCICGVPMYLHEKSAGVGHAPKVWCCPGCGMESWNYYRGFTVLVPPGKTFEESVGLMMIVREVVEP